MNQYILVHIILDSRDSITGIVSAAGRFHIYPVTYSVVDWKYEYTRHRPIFSYFLNFQDESRRFSSYFFKANIDRTEARLSDEQTDEISFVPEIARRDETISKKPRSSVRPMSSYGQTIANPV